MSDYLTHPWPPVYDAHSRVLILGTFPSPRSRAEGFYFGHPANVFWRTLADVLTVPRLAKDATKEQKTAWLLSQYVALWDVLAACRITGAADASITEPVANQFRPLLEASAVKAIFTTGRKATELYNTLAAAEAGMQSVYLPSTSPANRAQQSRPEFMALWSKVAEALN